MAHALLQRRARRALLLAAAAALGAGACLTKPALVSQTFSIDPPAARAGVAPPDGAVFSLAHVNVAAVYGGAALVYRVGDHAIERDPYASLAAAPGSVLTAAVRGYLRNADFVRDVVSPGDGVPVAALIEVDAAELCGDFQNLAEPVAVLTLQFRVVTPLSGSVPARELLVRTYSQRIRIPQRTAGAVAAGWNQALGEIMAAFCGDLKTALPARKG